MRELGVFYANGWGGPKDLVTAKSWLERAAAAGNEQANKDLAVINKTGK
jgi:TPR repeat protein